MRSITEEAANMLEDLVKEAKKSEISTDELNQGLILAQTMFLYSIADSLDRLIIAKGLG